MIKLGGRESLFCASCGKTISGAWITAMGKLWHPEHFVCAFCSQSIREGSFHENEGQPYHRKCFVDALALHCVACGRDCPESYIQDSHRGIFCPQCFAVAASCFYCGRTLPRGKSCPICVPIVNDLRVAAQELSHAISWFKSTGILFQWTARDIQLSLTNTVPSRRLIQHTGARSMGWTEVRWTDNGSGRRYDILVAMKLSLPSLVFRGVAAHELGHVWLLTNGITQLREDETEGFCELLSHEFYKSMKTPEANHQAKRIRENPDAIYGDGFRNLVEAHQGMDLPRLAAKLKHRAGGKPQSDQSSKWKWFS
jgi:hypothetical protein